MRAHSGRLIQERDRGRQAVQKVVRAQSCGQQCNLALRDFIGETLIIGSSGSASSGDSGLGVQKVLSQRALHIQLWVKTHPDMLSPYRCLL